MSAELGKAPDSGSLEVYKRAVADAIGQRQPRPRIRWKLGWAAAVATLLVLALVGYMSFQRETPILYRIGAGQWADDGQAWVNNPGTTPVPITFENGSRLELGGRTAARVLRAKRDQVAIDLDQGDIHAEIVGNAETSWLIHAGPYRIMVLGTIFKVRWEVTAGELEVEVLSGKVAVSSIHVAAETIVLEGGQRVIAKGKNYEIVRERSAAGDHRANGTASRPVEPEPTLNEKAEKDIPPSTTVVPKPTTKVALLRANEKKRGGPPATPPQNEPVSEPSALQRCIDARDWSGAVDAISNEELDQIVQSESLDVLWPLANRARHTAKAEVASQLFEAIRRRFANTNRAETAAFLLGKIALHLNKDLKGARDWLETYRKESPQGALIEESLGLLIGVYRQLGDNIDARRVALEYLQHYKGGLFEERARRALRQQGGS